MRTCRSVALLLLAVTPLFAQSEPAWSADVRAAIEEHKKATGIPGLSCAIGVGGTIQMSAGFGFADVENEVPATPQTVYRLGSISKPVTAVIAMQFVEQGKLDLDADVGTIVPEWPKKEWPVTTRQLLSHLGGVRHYRGEDESTKRYETQTAGLVRFAADPLLHEPGTKYLYSTYGYNLVAAAIEKVAGKPFPEVVREQIAVPAGAPTLQDDDLRRIIPHRAQGYERRGGKLQNSELMDGSYKLGGGGLCCSAEDLVRFAQALLADKLVKRETREQMWTQQAQRDGTLIDYAIGFRTGSMDGRRLVAHGGAQARITTMLLLLPDDGVVVALLCNLEGARLPPLAQKIATMVATKAK